MTFHTSLLDLVQSLGTKILSSPYLVGVLDDKLAFSHLEDRPLKVLLRQMLHNGVVQSVLQLGQWSDDARRLSSQFCQQTQTASRAMVNYVVESIAYAMGWLTDVNDPNHPTMVSHDPQLTSLVGEDVVEYNPRGSQNKIGCVIPTGMVTPVYAHLDNLALQYGSVGEYVCQELGVDQEKLDTMLSGEQIDGVAMAINEMKQGRGFILGDMTGVGKGRQIAALLVWAYNRGVTPVFVTEKSILFSDMYRDLKDIGYGHLRPFILNADNEARVFDEFGRKVYGLPSRGECEWFRQTKTLPVGYDMLWLTYSQMNRPETVNWKAECVREVMKGTYIMLDESHNASGQESTMGQFFLKAIAAARGVCFSSATFAKYPSSMPLYAVKTAMADALMSSEELIKVVSHGGPILQEEMAKGLTESGSMIRRQRDMKGVVREIFSPTDPALVDSVHQRYDTVIEVIQDIYDFQHKYIDPILEDWIGDTIESELRHRCKVPKTEKFIARSLRVDFAAFAQRLAPVIRQLVFAIKADDAVQATLEAVGRGEKPILQINRTMESQLESILLVGNRLQSTDFTQLLRHSLDALFHYSLCGITEVGKGKTHRTTQYRHTFKLTLDDIEFRPDSQDVKAAYAYIIDKIAQTVTGIPLSPIDYFVHRIEEAGLRVGELTQRHTRLELAPADGGLPIRVMRQKPDIKQVAKEFNNGHLDVLVGNRVMSTGISLHASPRYQDQRPRCIITWEMQDSADKQTQFDGRADRTGQLTHCHYVVLSSAVPAEQRYLMMSERKQRSLNANVTASQKTDSPCLDMLNRYGSRVVKEYLLEHPEMAQLIPDMPEKWFRKDSDPDEELVHHFMQSLPLLRCQDQEAMFNEVMQRYITLMQELDNSGENDIEVKVLPLKAKLLGRQVFSQGNPYTTSIFGGDAYLDELEVNVLRKPMTAAEVKQQMAGLSDALALKPRLASYRNARYQNITDRYRQLRNIAKAKLDELMAQGPSGQNYTPTRIQELKEQAFNQQSEQEQLNKISHDVANLQRQLCQFQMGEAVGIPMALIEGGEIDDPKALDYISMGIFLGYHVIGSQPTASTIKAVFAVCDSRRKLEIPLSEGGRLTTIRQQSDYAFMRQELKKVTLAKWDSLCPQQARERAWVITGNILQGIAVANRFGSTIRSAKKRKLAQSKGRGRLICYTDEQGHLCHGYLMPRIFRPADIKLAS